MPVMLKNGRVLLRGGRVANDEKCCRTGFSVGWLYYSPLYRWNTYGNDGSWLNMTAGYSGAQIVYSIGGVVVGSVSNIGRGFDDGETHDVIDVVDVNGSSVRFRVQETGITVTANSGDVYVDCGPLTIEWRHDGSVAAPQWACWYDKKPCSWEPYSPAYACSFAIDIGGCNVTMAAGTTGAVSNNRFQSDNCSGKITLSKKW